MDLGAMKTASHDAGQSDWMETIHFEGDEMVFSAPKESDDAHSSDLAVVSLGCYCGVKLSFRKLGLAAATLPLDWTRTRIEKVLEFFRTDFERFLLDVHGPIPVPDTNLLCFRGTGHSFWHDDIRRPDVHEKLKRRIDRLLTLSETSPSMLFVRALATTDELAFADELYAELVRKFRRDACQQVHLLVIVCNQKRDEPLTSAASKGLLIYTLTPNAFANAAGDSEAAPFCKAVSWALQWLSGQSSEPREVPDASWLLSSGEVTPDSYGLDGMNGIVSFQRDSDGITLGSRVEAWYDGSWYVSTVLALPNAAGLWKVHCDVDGPNVNLETHIRPITPSEQTLSDAQPKPAASATVQQQQPKEMPAFQTQQEAKKMQSQTVPASTMSMGMQTQQLPVSPTAMKMSLQQPGSPTSVKLHSQHFSGSPTAVSMQAQQHPGSPCAMRMYTHQPAVSPNSVKMQPQQLPLSPTRMQIQHQLPATSSARAGYSPHSASVSPSTVRVIR
mmetsp:Transcript_37512/g.67883  ORF Transcript_37512/g.67883 Transcript_37512/m.67883 type:complete len:501 (+) Transcript_37512:39-1541(+)